MKTMEHEQKMAMDRAEHDLRMSIMLQCVAAYDGSTILQVTHKSNHIYFTVHEIVEP